MEKKELYLYIVRKNDLLLEEKGYASEENIFYGWSASLSVDYGTVYWNNMTEEERNNCELDLYRIMVRTSCPDAKKVYESISERFAWWDLDAEFCGEFLQGATGAVFCAWEDLKGA